MAESIVSICNNALILIGKDSIASLEDQTAGARKCKQRWDSVRDAVLRDHEWACCMKEAALAASSTAPLSWDYAYPLPSDCIRVVGLSDTDKNVIDAWEVMAGELLCDTAAPVVLRYVRRETDPAKYDSMLSEAFSARLALELCTALAGPTTLLEAMNKLYQDRLRGARGVNARDRAPRTLFESRWRIAKNGS